jgi:hypothetical protein
MVEPGDTTEGALAATPSGTPAASELTAGLASLSTAIATPADGEGTTIEIAAPDANAEEDNKALTDAVALYNKKFLKKDKSKGYEDGYAKPIELKGGHITFKFPSEADSVKFFLEVARASGDKPFELYDKNKNLIAFFMGAGDDHLYRAPKPEDGHDPKSSQRINEGERTFGKAQPQEEEATPPSP